MCVFKFLLGVFELQCAMSRTIAYIVLLFCIYLFEYQNMGKLHLEGVELSQQFSSTIAALLATMML